MSIFPDRISGLRLGVVATAIAVVGLTYLSSQPVSASDDFRDLPDVSAAQITDSISEAELSDLQTYATQEGISLQSVVDRHAWNDNFGVAVSMIRNAVPNDFAGSAITDKGNAWVAFSSDAPEEALAILKVFSESHSTVEVEVRTGLGFNENELLQAIEAVHFSVLEQAGVSNATTTHDYDSGRIDTTVILNPKEAADVGALRIAAVESLRMAGLESVLSNLTVEVGQAQGEILGGLDSANEHLGGEALSQCTSGFGTKTAAGVRGISTAGHCGDALTDDGKALTLVAQHEGVHGDFQWHTGAATETDDFYAGNATTLEVDRRDVSGIGAPQVGQLLCKNGKTNFKDCQKVRKLNVCHSVMCNLVQMEARLAASGDSGGPVYYSNTAYGLHQGWHYDLAPFDRDLFSRADRLDNAVGPSVATS